ncbi:probable cytochrome P450 6a13 [Adelges cooleyi]|uniref:probable cytochrome P450 6a13 n=1 Tax=Adelges cooleyi TaxID=133065 RepID=UPI00217F9337|nr:probable cytochrome P450 6a13 [Adelges cooleyi]
MFKSVFESFDIKLSILAAVVALLYAYVTWNYSYWSKSGVKTLRTPIPLFGHFFKSIVGLQHTMEVIDTIYQEMGDQPYIGVYNMRTPQLVIKDPELIGRVLIKDFSHFTDRGIYYDIHSNPLNGNIFLTGGERWRTMRQKLSPAFTTNKLKYMIEQIQECSDILLKTIGQSIDKESGKMEIRDMMGKYSTDVIGSCAFGLKVDAINDPDSEFRKHGKAVFTPSYKSQLRAAIIFMQPSLVRLLGMNFYSQKTIDFFRDAFQQTIHYRQLNDCQRNDFVHHLMKARKDLVLNPELKDEEKYSELDIVANAYILFVAGFETVSTSMSFCLYELALKTDIQERARKEIAGVKAENGGKLDVECLNKLHYLNMIIKETLRKYPPLITLNRIVTKPYTIPDTDITLRPGTKIIIPAKSIHYDPENYPNPLNFDPERYSEENINKLHPNTYMPFGDGPRFCIGKRFAEFEMKLALSEVLTNYEVLPCEKTQVPIQYVIGSLVNIPKSVWLKFRPINV